MCYPGHAVSRELPAATPIFARTQAVVVSSQGAVEAEVTDLSDFRLDYKMQGHSVSEEHRNYSQRPNTKKWKKYKQREVPGSSNNRRQREVPGSIDCDQPLEAAAKVSGTKQDAEPTGQNSRRPSTGERNRRPAPSPDPRTSARSSGGPGGSRRNGKMPGRNGPVADPDSSGAVNQGPQPSRRGFLGGDRNNLQGRRWADKSKETSDGAYCDI